MKVSVIEVEDVELKLSIELAGKHCILQNAPTLGGLA